MNNNRHQVTLFLSVILAGLSSLGADRAKITIKTVDEEGKPLVGMPVSASFYQAYAAKGESDRNGLFVLEGYANMGEANYFAQKEGYYSTEGRYTFSPVWSPEGGRFAPWNPVVTCIVRRVINPIPMYARAVNTSIPVTNAPCGYDLMIGDWVAPYGRGSRSDFAFTIEGFNDGVLNYESHLTLHLSKCVNGIQRLPLDQSGSAYILCRSAPENAYAQTWTNTVGYLPRKGFFETQGGTFADPQAKRWGYAFRIRSVTSEQGEVTEALYGKLRGPIRFFNCTERVLQFIYYLNPTPNDRNLEFDPKRNLFKNLKSTEEVPFP